MHICAFRYEKLAAVHAKACTQACNMSVYVSVSVFARMGMRNTYPTGDWNGVAIICAVLVILLHDSLHL